MATTTINFRVDTEIRDALQERADELGLDLSKYVRDLLLETVVPVRDEGWRRDTFAPETMSPMERQVLSIVHRTLARVLPEGANDVDGDREYQLERARVIEKGFTAEYETEFSGIEPELSPRDCERVKDILDMFRIIEYSLSKLAEDGDPLDGDVAGDLTYMGFDFNDRLEGHMADYVEYLVSQGRWEERKRDLEGPGRGNSHMQTLDLYLRMLAEYRRIKEGRPRSFRPQDYLLSREELKAIADATVHPTNRKR
jgi:uncharacterized protein YfbU (UPF0304 family)